MIGLQESISGLNDHIGALENAIGASSFGISGGIPNPNSICAGNEIQGGTFSTDGGIHKTLKGELDAINGGLIGSSISGGDFTKSGSSESKNIHYTGAIGSAMGNKLDKVKESVNERVTNILTLQTVLDGVFSNLLNIIKSSDDSTHTADIENIKFVKDKINDSLNNETQALQKVLQTHIKPSSESIKDLMKQNATFAALANNLGVDYDTDEGSDRLAIAYTNLSHTGLVVEKIKSALKTLSMTINDYSQLKNTKDLENKLTSILKNVNKPAVKSKLSKILDAIQILRNNQYKHNEVIDCLKDDKKSLKIGLGESSEGGDITGENDFSTNVLGRVRKFKTRSTLSRNIKTYEKTLKELFKSFMSQININFKEIQNAVENVSEELGKSIMYDEKIKNFVNIFESLGQDMNNSKLFYALIVFDDTIASKEIKIRFLTNLEKLIESLNELKSHKYLNEIQKQLVAVKENIDTYTDTVTGFKNSEVKVKDGSDDKSGGDDFYWTNKILDKSVSLNVSQLIKDTITKLKFYGNISQIKSSLNSTLHEFVSYKEDYDKLLGKSIGTKINELTREYNQNIDRLHNIECNRGKVLSEHNKSMVEKDDQIPKGLVETIYKLQYDAKVGLYKTVEAIDLYLMNFTELLSGNVEATKELNKMLQQTEVIAKWYNKNSGDKLFDLMKKIIYDNSGDKNTSVNDVQTFITGKTIKSVLESCKESIDSVSMLKNILSMFVHIGDKFGNKTLSKEMYMSPNIMYKNLIKYIWVSAFTMGYGTGGGDASFSDSSNTKKDKNGYDKEFGDKASFFNVHFTQLAQSRQQSTAILGSGVDGDKVDPKLLNAFMSDPRLKQMIAARRAKTDKDISESLDSTPKSSDSTPEKAVATKFMTSLMNNLFKTKTVTSDPVTIKEVAKTISIIKDSPAFDNQPEEFQSLVESIDTSSNNITNLTNIVNTQITSLSSISSSQATDIFETDDIYFVLVLKAITAKILTVIGTAHILRQPKSVVGLITNPVRAIIGGAKDPEVIDDAFELYIRLPLLVEFYKNVFEDGNRPYKRNKNSNDDTETIAYIPEIGSVWSGLIQCIFDESRYIKDGIYSLDNMRRIISEVNNIYKQYKNVDKNKLVRTVVLDLVADVNKRYGVLKKQEIDEFYQLKKKYIKNPDNDISTNHVNFDILDENNEFEDVGPSSKYTENIYSKSTNDNIVTNDIKLVKDFHNKIHNELFSKKSQLKDLDKKSFSEKIKFYKNEVNNKQDNKQKLDLIIKAIDDSSNINSHNDEVSLLFHELVVAPIKNLQAVHNIIDTMFTNYLPIMSNSLLKDEKDEYNVLSNGLGLNSDKPKFNKITLIEFLYSYLSDIDNLASIKFINNNKFIIDYSKLQHTVETSIENIKYMVSKFRSQVSETVIKKYEECVLNLEDKLLLKMINCDDNNTEAKYDLYNFDYMNSTISFILKDANDAILHPDLYKAIMFRSNDKSETQLLSGKNNMKIWDDIFSQYGGARNKIWNPIHLAALPVGAVAPNDDFAHLNALYKNLDKPKDSSILYGFNSLVYEYLCTFYDASTKKIYNNLFNEFVNKSQSSVIFGRKGIPDIKSTQDLKNIANNIFIENDHILCETLGYMFKTIVNRTTNVQLPTKNHLLMTLSEVSPNFIEKYKVYLPVFIKLFETLIHKSLLCKKVLETTDENKLKGSKSEKLNSEDRSIEGDLPGDKQTFDNKWITGDIFAHIHYNNTLNNIIEASRALINDATAVLSEINTKQQFFELKENFIKNYYNNNNKLPLMPLSLNTTILNNNIFNKSPFTLLPYPNKNDNEFKFLYGINSVINNKSLDNNINSYIWLKEELKNYNNGSLSVNKIDVGKINDYIEMNNKLSISLSSVLCYNQFLNADNTNKKFNFNTASGICANTNTYYTSLPEQSVLNNAIDSVDSTSIDNTKRKLSNIIQQSTTKLDISRVNARFLNIIDLNIVPLNIHALMREIPLTNIYNYAFTYDHIVKQLFGEPYNYTVNDTSPSCDNLLLKLFLNPYHKCGTNESSNRLLLNTLTGEGKNIKLGRSKYISDILAHAIGAVGAVGDDSTYVYTNKNVTSENTLEKKNWQKNIIASNNNIRLHNKYFRNLIFLTNLQRLIHHKIKTEVEIINSKVVSDMAITNSQIVNYTDDHKNLEETDFEYFMSDD
jgi:hypothetical protein